MTWSHDQPCDLPDWYHKEEEKAEQNITNVTKDTVEGAQGTRRVGTLEVVVALVLITTEIENLKYDSNWVKQSLN